MPQKTHATAQITLHTWSTIAVGWTHTTTALLPASDILAICLGGRAPGGRESHTSTSEALAHRKWDGR